MANSDSQSQHAPNCCAVIIMWCVMWKVAILVTQGAVVSWNWRGRRGFPMLLWWKDANFRPPADPAAFIYSSPLSSWQTLSHVHTVHPALASFMLLAETHWSTCLALYEQRLPDAEQANTCTCGQTSPPVLLYGHTPVPLHMLCFTGRLFWPLRQITLFPGVRGQAVWWLNMWPCRGMLLVFLLWAGFPFGTAELGPVVWLQAL